MSPPYVEKERFAVARSCEFIRVIGPRRNGDYSRSAHKVLGHLHKLIGFGLGEHPRILSWNSQRHGVEGFSVGTTGLARLFRLPPGVQK